MRGMSHGIRWMPFSNRPHRELVEGRTVGPAAPSTDR
jgi:hypothetical protein